MQRQDKPNPPNKQTVNPKGKSVDETFSNIQKYQIPEYFVKEVQRRWSFGERIIYCVVLIH